MKSRNPLFELARVPLLPNQPAVARASRPKKRALDNVWQEWLAHSLLEGAPPAEIVAIMIRNGFGKSVVERKIHEMRRSPVFAAGREFCRSRNKIASLLEVFRGQFRQAGFADQVPKVDDLSPSEFFREFYFANRPVILRGLMKGWKALQMWTPHYFAREFGNCTVEIMCGRNRDTQYDRNPAKHMTTMTMKNYVRMVMVGGESNDYYLTARNYLLRRSSFKVLLNHIKCPKGYLDSRTIHDARFWFGPKGTVTPLHHDPCNSMLGQVCGRKQIKLISPFDLENVYHEGECFSAVDLGNLDFEKFPRMRRVSILNAVIEPGEFLFTPIGWWHWVKSLDVSISLSFVNFCVQGGTVIWQQGK